jgi:hypothetical protein
VYLAPGADHRIGFSVRLTRHGTRPLTRRSLRCLLRHDYLSLSRRSIPIDRAVLNRAVTHRVAPGTPGCTRPRYSQTSRRVLGWAVPKLCLADGIGLPQPKARLTPR